MEEQRIENSLEVTKILSRKCKMKIRFGVGKLDGDDDDYLHPNVTRRDAIIELVAQLERLTIKFGDSWQQEL